MVVAVRLRHLAPVGAGKLCRGRQQRLRFGEDIDALRLRHIGSAQQASAAGLARSPIELVEPARHLARQFHVRHLVLPHRNKVRQVHQDVGRLQQRVSEKSVGAETFFGKLSCCSL